MKTNIEEFNITGLYGKRDYNVIFDDNQLILVGENGSGKSTIVSILNYLLTCQWEKLFEYDFKALSLKVNGKTYTFDKMKYTNISLSNNRNINELQYIARKINEIGALPEKMLHESNYKIRNELFHLLQISPSFLKRSLEYLSDDKQLGLYSMEISKHLFEELNEFKNALNLNVLYLPTYRRIERELNKIFPSFEEDSKRMENRFANINNDRKHLELVEFGMSDVRNMIDNTMKTLDTQFRASLDELTGGYLRVILRKEYENTDVSILQGIDDQYLDDILQKIDESVLSTKDQKTLRDTIKRFGDVEPINDIDKLSAHIITKLVLLHKKQFENEDKVRSFSNVCNNYLKGKKFLFNNTNFTLPIIPNEDDSSAIVSNKEEIDISMLSSGEKQIVSLFSHLYLSNINNYFIIIDEPELSLSVPWQKTLLPDIVNSNKCNGFVAVTHSPFIYANDFERKAHSVQEFCRIKK